MLLSCAMEGGDLLVAELVQNLGAEGAWAKIIEVCWGSRPRSALPGSRLMWRTGWQAQRRCVSSARVRRSGRPDLMIFNMPRAFSDAVASRLGSGCEGLGIWLI